MEPLILIAEFLNIGHELISEFCTDFVFPQDLEFLKHFVFLLDPLSFFVLKLLIKIGILALEFFVFFINSLGLSLVFFEFLLQLGFLSVIDRSDFLYFVLLVLMVLFV